MPIPEFPGYEASDCGKIRSVDRFIVYRYLNGKTRTSKVPGKVKIPHVGNSGYLLLSLSVKNVPFRSTVHKLVASAFLGPRPYGKQVCHCNGIKTDNRSKNLRYATASENSSDRIKHKTIYRSASFAKINLDIAKQIRKDLSAGDSPCYLSEKYGITERTIRRIRNKSIWKYE